MPQQQDLKPEFEEMSKIPLVLRFAVIFFFFFLSSSSADQHFLSRHLLHQPFFPVITAAPPPYQPLSSSEPPSPSPHTHHHHMKQPATPPPHEKHLFSSVPNPPPSPPPYRPHPNPFFPSSDPSSTASHPPPPSPPPPASLPTFPANISSLLFPTHNNPSKSNHNRHIAKLVAITVSVVSAAILLSLFVVLFIFLRRAGYHRRSSPVDDTKSTRSDSLHLFNAAPSDGSLKRKQQQQPPKYTSSNTSSEFLYLGTLVNSRTGNLDQQKSPIAVSGSVTGVLELTAPASSSSSSYSQYHKLGSPELRPLPPLPKLPAFTPTYQSTEQLIHKKQNFDGDDNEYYEFFSPRGSSGRKQSPTRVRSSLMKDSRVDQIGDRSINGSNSCSPTNSVSSLNGSPATSLKPNTSSPPLLLHCRNSLKDPVSKQHGPARSPPPPPPVHPPQFCIPATTSLSPPRGDSGHEVKEKNETLKPKLKPLHWDKVRASSSRVMVWDQIKSNSFQLNEEMIETLFRANDPSSRTRDAASAIVVQSSNQENRFLDPRKSHNIAILLRALNVTVDEVCEALVEGNSDMLGPELLECLLKMAPTKEEETKLKELKDDDDGESHSKLGPAEKFLKALLNIPLAFKRIDAMLYIVNFESETEYLKRSFDTLKAACSELKNNRMFLKLLEAVLKTGNRMNIGTNRGDAHAFKLDTLLKLVDIKGADGRTTLLHFVVQEIIKSEGARACSNPIQSPIAEQSSFQDDLELKKLGLQVVSGLSSQLINVKKAAAMDSNSLSNETEDIVSGITKVKEVITELKQETEVERFLDSMNMFLNKAEKEITELQSHGSNVLKLVKEVTEYFHRDSETYPFRIFAVVRDFLTILDQVCKEVGRVNERTVYGSVPRPSPYNQIVTPLFPVVNNNSRLSHSGSLEDDDDGSF